MKLVFYITLVNTFIVIFIRVRHADNFFFVKNMSTEQEIIHFIFMLCSEVAFSFKAFYWLQNKGKCVTV